MTSKHLSSECGKKALDQTGIVALRARRAEHVRLAVSSLGEVRVRTFCPVTIDGREMLADIVTGSLYADGQCLTTRQLRIVHDATPAPAQPKPRNSLLQIMSGFCHGRMRNAAA